MVPHSTIHAPRINANDVEMRLVAWHVGHWQEVETGDLLCEVESTKSVVQIESEQNGFVYPAVEPDSYVKVGEILGYVLADRDVAQVEALLQIPPQEGDVVVSKKARALMEEHGLDVSDFPTMAVIGSEAVVAVLRSRHPLELDPQDTRYAAALESVRGGGEVHRSLWCGEQSRTPAA